MAYTVTKVNSVFGDQRAVMLNITADAATQTIQTGLSVINGMALGAQSLTTMGIKCYANSNASGVQAFGSIGMSGLVSGDQLFVTVYGK